MPESSDAFEGVGPDRRTFVKRLVLGSLFAYPVVSSFTMSGIDATVGSRSRTDGSIATACNSSPPPAPSSFPVEVGCTCLFSLGASTFNLTDNGVQISVTIPSGAFAHTQTNLCVFRGNLATLGSAVPAGQSPVSAYAVKWNHIITGTAPALVPLTLTVTDPSVKAGDQLFAVDSGAPVTTGGTVGNGTWSVSFTNDLSFVVTQAAPAPPVTASFTG